ncbi:hypothetical protein ANO11243_027520 [Dothideomycetidae sp. 11243]|nr:hypothetical protein ANO11243_027520 [fungal sp. No.11243]
MSSNTSSSPRTFLLFPRLPGELRLEIWRASLPPSPLPGLYQFRKKRAWKTRRIGPTATEPPRPALAHEFCADYLGRLRYIIPPAFVNHEAHAVAVPWIRSYGLKYNARDGYFTRPFDSERDAVYIANGQAWVEAFLADLSPSDTHYAELGVVPDDITYTNPVKMLAISEAELYRFDDWMAGYFFYRGFENVVVMLIVLDAPQELTGAIEDYDPSVWEWADLGVGSFHWDELTDSFHLVNGTGVGHEDRYARIKEKIGHFFPAAAHAGFVPMGFEVYLVRAIRKNVLDSRL